MHSHKDTDHPQDLESVEARMRRLTRTLLSGSVGSRDFLLFRIRSCELCRTECEIAIDSILASVPPEARYQLSTHINQRLMEVDALRTRMLTGEITREQFRQPRMRS